MLNYDRVVFKAPNEGHAADLLMEALPKVGMIFLIRDGRNVVKSRFSPFASRILAKSEDPGLRRAAVAYYAINGTGILTLLAVGTMRMIPRDACS